MLNNKSIVSEKTKTRVLDAVKKLNYHPNLTGRNLRKNETRLILVVMNSIVNSFFSKVIKSIEERAETLGYNILICTTDNDDNKIRKYLNLLNTKIADGAILLGIDASNNIIPLLNNMSEHIPIVQCSEYKDELNLPVVTIDNFSAVYDAVTYFISRGRKNILHISCSNASASTIERLHGYKAALKDNGIKYNPDLVIESNYGYRSTLSLMNEFLKKNIKTDAVLANNDRMAAAAVNVLLENKFKIPEDVMVIGFDNSTICYMLNPTLSSVAQPQIELGKQCVNTLYKIINNEPFEYKTILGYEIKHKKTTNYGKDV